MGLGSELATFARYAGSLPAYFRTPLGEAQARAYLASTLAAREANFLHVVEHAVFRHPASPYRHLFAHLGVGLDDIRALVAAHGLEGALGVLYDRGLFVTLDEVKGRRPIVRGSLTIDTTGGAFDNPLVTRHYEGMSSGSRGPRTRVNLDLAMLAHEAAYVWSYLEGFGLKDRPYAVWRPVPPVATAIKWIMRLEKIGKPLDRWFSQTQLGVADGQWKFAVFTWTTVGMGRVLGRRVPAPHHVPTNAPQPVAEWLSEMSRRGTPAVLDTMVSSAVRLCADALERGIDISGTLFRLGGEPLTAAKAQLMADAGCRSICFYSITEMSFVGAPCGDGQAADDVHLLSDKVVALQRERQLGEQSVQALIYTTLLPSSPKLLINVESGDFATLTERDCRCPMGRLGFRQHLSHIRSYEKLTSEGVSFLGTELLRLVEEVLPGRFGGGPTDYQLAEVEVGGLTRINVVASPRLGPLVDAEVIELVLETLRAYPGGAAMVEHWRQGSTLTVERREPYRTASAKFLPLFRQQAPHDQAR